CSNAFEVRSFVQEGEPALGIAELGVGHLRPRIDELYLQRLSFVESSLGKTISFAGAAYRVGKGAQGFHRRVIIIHGGFLLETNLLRELLILFVEGGHVYPGLPD